MIDRLFFALLALLVAAMIGLALVWPQGQGERSPPPFGHATAPAKPPKRPAQPPTLSQEP
jgi:hypothetical protein